MNEVNKKIIVFIFVRTRSYVRESGATEATLREIGFEGRDIVRSCDTFFTGVNQIR